MSGKHGTIEERFWPKVNKYSANGCWQWTAHIDRRGYGRFKAAGTTYAHRVSWNLHYGDVPEGLILDHLCRNRSCVNPRHLDAVTHRTNILRGVGQTAKEAKKTYCVYGHPLSGENVFWRHAPSGQYHRICRACNLRRGYEFRKRHPTPKRTHCPQKHEYTPDNTYMDKGKITRRCRICSRKRAMRYRRDH